MGVRGTTKGRGTATWLLPFILVLCACAERQASLAQPREPGAVLTEADRPVGRGSTSFAARGASVEEVDLAVPLTAETRDWGQCDAPFRSGLTHLRMSWTDGQGQTQRAVIVAVDPEGDVLRYSDLRGSATMAPSAGRSDPGTAISLSFDSELALVRNTGGAESGALVLPFSDALEAGQLDDPRFWMEEVLERCSPR